MIKKRKAKSIKNEITILSGLWIQFKNFNKSRN